MGTFLRHLPDPLLGVPIRDGPAHRSQGKLPVSQLYNNFAFGHVMITDDGGDTWRMSDEWGNGEGAERALAEPAAVSTKC